MMSKGFTIFELIIVMAIIGILAISIIVGANLVGSKAIAEAGALKANLRFTQSKAMSDLPGNIWSLNITASDKYKIQRNGTDPDPKVILPCSNSNVEKESETYTLPNGVTITSGTGLIRFNFRGQPVDGSGSPLGANFTITISGAPQIIVTRETGFVP